VSTTNDAPLPSSPRRRLRLGFVSQIRLRLDAAGRVYIDGCAVDQAHLSDLAGLIGAASTGALLPVTAAAAIAEGSGRLALAVTDSEGQAAAGACACKRAPQPADPAQFLTARTERAFNAWTSVRALWTSYLGWAGEQQFTPLARPAFCDAMKAAGLRYGRRRPATGERMERGWSGARLSTQLRLVDAVEERHG
jgi:hypothetical protein